MNIDGTIYYGKLVEDESNTKIRSLYGDYKNRMDLIRSGIIVCRNVPIYHRWIGMGGNPDTGKTERKYTLFPSHIDLYNHIMKIPVEKRSFFEIIQGNKPHKPHFDIDFDMSKCGLLDIEVTMSSIIDAIVDTIQNNGVILDLSKDVLIYTSSRPEKASYHIIVNGWMHNDNKDAKNLAKQIRSNFPPDIAEHIDKSVYSTKQQFRLLHCTKLRTKNTKVPIPIWKTSKYTITYPTITNSYDEFLASLVGVTIGCNHIPSFYDPEGPICVGPNGIEQAEHVSNTPLIEYKIELKKKDIDKCLTELYRKTEDVMGCAKNSTSIWNVFSVRSIEGGFISLTKKRPYFCPICARQHENENPYMIVNGKGYVKYFCRRSETSILITTLEGYEPTTIDQVQEIDVESEVEEFTGITPKLLEGMKFHKLNMESNVIKEEQREKRKSGFTIYTNYNRWRR